MDNPPVLQADVSVQATEVRPRATLKSKANEEDSQMPKTGDNGMIIRGMTFYKSKPDPMVADDGQPGDNCKSKNYTLMFRFSFFHGIQTSENFPCFGSSV